jgi:hypothetical protein
MTSPETSPAEVKAEWQKRRTRLWFSFGLFLCVTLILLLVDFLLEPTPGKPGLPTPLYRFLTILSMGVFLVLLQRNSRCPACGKHPGVAGQPFWRVRNCTNRGAQLQD